ncbi:17-beta-hydroxysteroid dehydrogenase type 1 [Echinops telfairi]|uniref:17-beta-hydroxysteroid dehydrogenase type 1 n=1 Tax=Echinops telfairi TaxID=9371 RepID=A0AC55DUG3_ECHTE|nr:17-beta-hydroxysteroid dehydrogenase type 1 [Echinops telfairi]
MARSVVLITGCSSGIGLHLALRLASHPSQSFKVYATLRDLEDQGPLWEAAQAQGCPSGSLETLQLDVRDSESIRAARARVAEGRVDVLVCNAGRGMMGPLEAYEDHAVGSVLDVNVAGTVRVLQAFLPDMKRRRSGRVLVTGSMGGLMGERPAERVQLAGGGVFLTALHDPQPALRYYTTERFLPLLRLRFDDPSGGRYLAAMRRVVFQEESAEDPDDAPPAEPPAAGLGAP